MWQRKIIHLDMDAFFAAVEIRDNPSLKGKPVVVGGSPTSRGVVSTASYEARKFGIRSAMSAAQAKRLCPDAIFLKPNFSKYQEVSNQIHHIFSKYTSLAEPMSLDEAYLDVTQNHLKIEDPVFLAKMIQQNIRGATQLTASAGVASNKMLAKIASDMQKPAGLTVVFPNQVKTFLAPLSVRRIPGVGPVTEKELNKRGIQTIADLEMKSKEELILLFGKWGMDLYLKARGIDESPVIVESERKQLGSEETFERDLVDMKKLQAKLSDLSEEISYYLKQNHQMAKTVTLKVKYADFTTITRSHTLSVMFDDAKLIYQEVVKLLHEKTEAGRRPIRLLGVSVSHFEIAGETALPNLELDLFH